MPGTELSGSGSSATGRSGSETSPPVGKARSRLARRVALFGLIALLPLLQACEDLDGRASGRAEGELSAGLRRLVISHRHGRVRVRKSHRAFGWSWTMIVNARDDTEAQQILDQARLVRDAQSSATFTLTVPDSRHCRVDSRLELNVPEGCEVVVENDHGGVDLSGFQGGATVRLRHGKLTLDRVSGNLDLDVGHGRIRGNRLRGDARILSAHSRISLSDLQGYLHLETRHGRTDIRRQTGGARIQTAHGNLSFDRFEGGDVEISAEHSDLSLSGGSGLVKVERCLHGDIRLRTNARDIELQTRHGDIDLGVSEHARHIRATTEYGDVRLKLPHSLRHKGRVIGRSIRIDGRKVRGRSYESDDRSAKLTLDIDVGRRGTVRIGR